MFTRSNEANPEYWYFPLIGSLGTNECGLLCLPVTAPLDVRTKLQFGLITQTMLPLKLYTGNYFNIQTTEIK